MNIYCLGGLGIDIKSFKKLQINGHKLICLKWLKPEPDEKIENYANRMKEEIDVNKDFSIIGLSFGGIIGIEIAKKIKPHKLILISSVSTYKDFPIFYRIGAKTGMVKLISMIFNRSEYILNYLFGIETIEDEEFLREIIGETDNFFLKWALGAALNWKNEEEIDSIKIHGTDDKIFPPKKQKINYLIQKGTHFMIINKANEISKIIEKALGT